MLVAQSTLGLAAFGQGCRLLPAGAARMQARLNPATGQAEVAESGRPVLGYNYRQVEPGRILEQVAEPNRKYAVARSDYIHPLYGLEGEVLTRDWPLEHPHHRGIYWAWPEVDWRGERGDVHALQKVFARPTGKLRLKSGSAFAEIDAENVWVWENGPAIVRERAVLRAFAATAEGRVLDLRFEFTAIDEPVQIARRGAAHYGGLNIRLNTIREQAFVKHTDPAGAQHRMAWSDAGGVFPGASKACGVAVFQHPANPEYPGDWIEYPNLNWLQPTFPASGNRFELRPDRPLVLRYRILIHPDGSLTEAAARKQWLAAARG